MKKQFSYGYIVGWLIVPRIKIPNSVALKLHILQTIIFSFLCSLAVANAASSQLVGLKRLYILFRNYTKVRTNSLANATHAHSIFARVALCVGVRRASHVITSRLHLDDNS